MTHWPRNIGSHFEHCPGAPFAFPPPPGLLSWKRGSWGHPPAPVFQGRAEIDHRVIDHGWEFLWISRNFYGTISSQFQTSTGAWGPTFTSGVWGQSSATKREDELWSDRSQDLSMDFKLQITQALAIQIIKIVGWHVWYTKRKSDSSEGLSATQTFYLDPKKWTLELGTLFFHWTWKSGWLFHTLPNPWSVKLAPSSLFGSQKK